MKHRLRWLPVLALTLGLAASSVAAAKSHSSKKHDAKAPDAAQVGKYATVAIGSGKVGADRSAGVIYFDATQREAHRVTIKDGVVYDHTGAVVRATKSKRHDLNNYVMDAAGTFYLFDEFTTPTIRHSSILAGQPVAGAGNIQIADGRIVYIDSDSGHYPSTRVFANVLTELNACGVDVSTITKKRP
jgi:hypothetical protein